MSYTTHHMVISIAGLERELKAFKRSDRRRLYCYDMFGMSDTAVYEEIEKMKAAGYTVIPNEECDKRSPEGRCLGHPHEEKNNL